MMSKRVINAEMAELESKIARVSRGYTESCREAARMMQRQLEALKSIQAEAKEEYWRAKDSRPRDKVSGRYV